MLYNHSLKTLYIALRKKVQINLPPQILSSIGPLEVCTIECQREDGVTYSIACPFHTSHEFGGNILKLSHDKKDLVIWKDSRTLRIISDIEKLFYDKYTDLRVQPLDRKAQNCTVTRMDSVASSDGSNGRLSINLSISPKNRQRPLRESLPEKIITTWVENDASELRSRRNFGDESIKDFDTFGEKRISVVTEKGRVIIYSYTSKGSTQIYTSDQN